MVQLGTTLILSAAGITGGLGLTLLAPILAAFLGFFIDEGTFIIDISLDAYREGEKLDQFTVAATSAYEKATAKVYTDAQKDSIRQQYLAIISKISAVGTGPKSTS